MIPKITMVAARLSLLSVNSDRERHEDHGDDQRAVTTAWPSAHLGDAGAGHAGSAGPLVPPATSTPRCARPDSGPPVTSRATTTTTSSTGATYAGSCQCQSTDCSTMPRTIAAPTTVGSRSIRPMTAGGERPEQDRRSEDLADRAGRRSRPGGTRPGTPARSRGSTRRFGAGGSGSRATRPGRRARTPARIAMPRSLRRRNRAKPRSTIGTATTAATSLPRKMIGSIVRCRSNGAGIGRAGDREVAGEQQRRRGEQLRDPDRGDAEDQPR